MPAVDQTAMPEPSDTPGWQHFNDSARGSLGKSESSFYWGTMGGKPCIAKALTTEMGPHLRDFVNNERQVLRYLGDGQAPVCKLVEYPAQPQWLVTEFGGLSLDLLGGRGNPNVPALPLEEYVAVWAHFLYRAQSLDDLGAVPLDLASRNLVVPIGIGGQLKLNEALSIDHAHTIVPSGRLHGGTLKRPIWINPDKSPHLAPELREALKRDQEKLNKWLAEPLDLGTESQPATAQWSGQLPAKNWFDYAEPQEIQALVDRGSVESQLVMQYAVGHDIHRRLHINNPFTPALAAVLRRLCAADPTQRYKKLEHAADALKEALQGQLAKSSAHAYLVRLPADLKPQPSTQTPQLLLDLDEVSQSAGLDRLDTHSLVDDGGTIVGYPTDDSTVPDQPLSEKSDSAFSRWLWPLAAAVSAAAIGIPLGHWLATL